MFVPRSVDAAHIAERLLRLAVFVNKTFVVEAPCTITEILTVARQIASDIRELPYTDAADLRIATEYSQSFGHDPDGDGCHEIIYGAATIDHDGTMLYSSRAMMPPESKEPGKIVKLGHGDRLIPIAGAFKRGAAKVTKAMKTYGFCKNII